MATRAKTPVTLLPGLMDMCHCEGFVVVQQTWSTCEPATSSLQRSIFKNWPLKNVSHSCIFTSRLRHSFSLWIEWKESHTKKAISDRGKKCEGIFSPELATIALTKATMQEEKDVMRCLTGVKNKEASLRTKGLKFRVYVLCKGQTTRAQGLAGIIITHSSVTVTRFSLTSARVTHVLYKHTRPICIVIATSIASSQTPSVTFLQIEFIDTHMHQIYIY